MSLGTRLDSVLNVVLRVPPLFVIDEILRTLAYPSNSDHVSIVNRLEDPGKLEDSLWREHENSQLHEILLILAVRTFLVIFGTAISLFIFMLWTDHLVCLYLNLMPLGVVVVSYWLNAHAAEAVAAASTSGGCIQQSSIVEDLLSLRLSNLLHHECPVGTIAQNLVVQIVLNRFFRIGNLGIQNEWLHRLVLGSCLLPTFLMLLPLPVPAGIVRHSPVLASVIPLVLAVVVVVSNLVPGVQGLVQVYHVIRGVVRTEGTAAFLEAEWGRLNVPCVLRTFWLLRLAEHAAALLVTSGLSFSSRSDKHAVGREHGAPLLLVAFEISKNLLAQGCETMTAVLGMTSVISYICHYLGCLFQWMLLTEDDEEKPIGLVSALLFVLLALQTGLTGLEPEKRFVRLCRNLCLLLTAILHFFHNIVNPLLISLSASHSCALHRHARALLACAFLVTFPAALLIYLWSHQQVNHWLLAVSAFSIQVIVKVVVSLMIYTIFLIDAYRGTFWEKMDDYVYYVRVFGHSVDFLFGIFLFFNGACILIYESGGAIRAFMICLHAYINIWSEGRKGWRTFMKRRTAVNKINSLPDASAEQLSRLDDVCSICYQEMRSAKKTFCHHFFHGVCLRKWLYVQDHCPLCNEILYKEVTCDD